MAISQEGIKLLEESIRVQPDFADTYYSLGSAYLAKGKMAEAVKAFHPKVAIPYHYRGSDASAFQKALAGSGVEVKLLDWYH